MSIKREVFGLHLDSESRCIHYHSDKDVVSILFKCCNKWYACCNCHDALENHPIKKWEPCEFKRLAIQCGKCFCQIKIESYLEGENRCPSCKAHFNPKCKEHWDIYFDLESLASPRKVH